MNYSRRPKYYSVLDSGERRAATSEVINSLLRFKIGDFESSHVNLSVPPSKMALTLMRQRCDISVTQEKQVLCQAGTFINPFSWMSLQPNDRDRIKCTCPHIDRCH